MVKDSKNPNKANINVHRLQKQCKMNQLGIRAWAYHVNMKRKNLYI